MAHAFSPMTKSDEFSATITPHGLGIMWTLLLVATGIVHRAYSFQTTSPVLEILRQSGAIVLFGQLMFLVWARWAGWSPLAQWRNLKWPMRFLGYWFVATFWVSSAFYSLIAPFALMLCVGTLIQIAFAFALFDRLSVVDSGSVSQLQTEMFVGLAIIAVMTIVHFWSASRAALAPGEVIVWQASIPGFISVRLFGAVCSAVLTFLIATALTKRQNSSDALTMAVIIFMAGLTVWTGTRAAVAGLFGALLVGFVLLHVRPSARRLLVIAACVAVGALLGPMFAPAGDPVFQLFSPRDYSTASTAASGRFELWTAMIAETAKSPIFGLGNAAPRWAIPVEIFGHFQPHNFIVQFLSSWGLAGAIPAFALLGTATVKAHVIGRRLPMIVPVVIMLDALLLMALLDGILYFARETMMVMMCFAIIFAADRQSRMRSGDEGRLLRQDR
jgi:exopolysaccharide production protein ExoQ